MLMLKRMPMETGSKRKPMEAIKSEKTAQELNDIRFERRDGMNSS